MARPPGRYRYGSFTGGDDPLAPPFDVAAAVDQLGERVLNGSSVRDALREVLRRGTEDRQGLDELRRQISKRRRELRRSGQLSGALDTARAVLDQALAAERDALRQQDSEDAALAQLTLDALPDDVPGAMRALTDYQWQSPQARELYQSITSTLRDEVLQRQFAGMKQALQGGSPEGLERMQNMLADLNNLLAKHARREDVGSDFAEFMDKHGEFFPENPRNVDELVDALAKRQADTQRLMASLTPEQRAELSELIEQALADVDLASQMAQLSDNLTALRPGMMQPGGERVSGEQGLGYGDAVGVVSDLADLAELENQLAQDYPGATLDDVDVDALARQLSPAAASDVRRLQELERQLQRQGYLRRNGQELTLSPKALRRLGESALRHIFTDLGASGQGAHDDRRSGNAGEPTGAYLPWEVGSDRPIDAVRSVQNAVQRNASARGDDDSAGTGGAAVTSGTVTLEPDDLVAAETERRTTAAVALCVDLSFSMVLGDRWAPMKRTALALAHLIGTRFRSDALQIIGFDRTARVMSIDELATAEPDWVKGTNLQHALMLASRHLRRHPNAEPVVLVVTDGEPTAHLEPDGAAVFDYPPLPQTIRVTVAEADAVARLGATVNIFRLGDDPGLARFTDALARRVAGRVFAPEPTRLGEYVVSDYLRSRSGTRRAG